MASLSLDISHSLAAFDLELTLEIGVETVALVGPSGAGKTSVLRAIAGLVTPRSGKIALGGDVWFDRARGIDVAPESRRVGYVFQEYALFPHLTVRQNVAFGAVDEGIVGDLLERFRISALAGRRPGLISGGERQRVALARALARDPDVLLLDEPLSALDPHTRGTVRGELRALLRDAALPAIIVTHDFEDAAALADRVGVLVSGRLRQLGPAAEVVAAPVDPYVAGFVGANVLLGDARAGSDGLTSVRLDGGSIVRSTDTEVGAVAATIHPWEVSIGREESPDSAANHIHARITGIVRLGNRARVQVGTVTAEVTVDSLDRLGLREGDTAVASFKATATRLLPLA